VDFDSCIVKMEQEVDDLNGGNKSGVSIEITNPSDSEGSEYDSDFDELTEANIDRSNGNYEAEHSDNSNFDEEELDRVLTGMEMEEKEAAQNEDGEQKAQETDSEVKQDGGDEVEAVSSAIENDLKLEQEEEKPAKDGEDIGASDEEDKDKDSGVAVSAEIVGDRVLIERGGKFELVDVNEVKAEYFEMLGIKPEKVNNVSTGSAASDEKPSQNTTAEERKDEKPAESVESREKSPRNSTRPKTTSSAESRRKTNSSSRRDDYSRAQSAQQRHPNPEFSHIKSRYGMTEQQLEIKRRREEAIARRKKEEEEREREENERKRDDAERAFQAWLNAKNEEMKEFRKEQAKNRPDPKEKEEREKEAIKAYEHWRQAKRQQQKQLQQYEESRLMEEAESFVVRDRVLCEEAFRRWLKKKNKDLRTKRVAQKKVEKMKKRRRKKKEQIPVNSDSIKYVEYYGYRNTVVL